MPPQQPGFEIEIDRSRTSATVAVTGDIDMAAIDGLEQARERALAENPSQVVIDLRNVRFIDSSGLKFLLDTDRLSRSGGWTLQLVKPGETAMRVFTVTGADKHLPFIEADEL
jgi:anti-sigma B factor antagonist